MNKQYGQVRTVSFIKNHCGEGENWYWAVLPKLPTEIPSSILIPQLSWIPPDPDTGLITGLLLISQLLTVARGLWVSVSMRTPALAQDYAISHLGWGNHFRLPSSSFKWGVDILQAYHPNESEDVIYPSAPVFCLPKQCSHIPLTRQNMDPHPKRESMFKISRKNYKKTIVPIS